MGQERRIPIPLKHRWRLLRLQWLPLCMFLMASTGVIILINGQTGTPFATGQVNAQLYSATSGSEGVLVETGLGALEPFQRVQEGQVIARLDNRPVLAALDVLKAESGRLRLEVASARASWEQANSRLLVDSQSEWHRRMLQVELLRLDVLDRETQLELDRVSLQHEETRLGQAEQAFQGEAVNSLELSRVKALRDVITERINHNTAALLESKGQLEAARERLAQYEEPSSDELAAVLSPLQAAVDTQEARIQEVRLRAESLVIQSPIAGIISAVHRVPGQTVIAGEPVISVAAERGSYIVAYLRQSQHINPQVGMNVSVRMRSNRHMQFEAIIERVGASYESIPLEQLRDPTRPEWGLPVRISLRSDADLVPGELVDLHISSGS
ncbi:MAG: HlyD family efflux transporter periplasmic adaptor subunit [Phycisphaerales bacterium]|nr:HlyD family efflux transporter periplasmic adaptor subunit [Phycisphaerales bacterium]